MSFTNNVFSVGSILTAAEMNLVFGNFSEICSGNSGMPFKFAGITTDIKSSGIWYIPPNSGTYTPGSCFALYTAPASMSIQTINLQTSLTTSWTDLYLSRTCGVMPFDGARFRFINTNASTQPIYYQVY